MASKNDVWSLKGRLGPRAYWRATGMVMAVKVAAAVAYLLKPDWTVLSNVDALAYFVALLVGKRLKDCGVAAAWGWLAVVLITLVFPSVLILGWPQPRTPQHTHYIMPPWAEAAMTAALLALVIPVGLSKANVGWNRYGEVPAA